MTPEFLDLPYAQRQLITVVEDPVADKERTTPESDKKGADWIKVVAAALAATSPLNVVVAVAITEHVVRALQKMRSRGLEVVPVGRTEAQHLRFPLGHPRPRVLYAGHPSEQERESYYPMADFHRFLFELKVSEALDMLAALGATSIKIESLQGHVVDASFRAKIKRTSLGKAKGDFGLRSRLNGHILLNAKLANSVRPELHTRRVWFNDEPLWQGIAKLRLENSLSEFNLFVSYEDDFGVNASLKGEAAQSGLELGGQFEERDKTVWQLSGEFGKVPPLKA